MPIPSPKGKQTEKSFIDKCMSDPSMTDEFKDNKQRYAVCVNQYKRSKKIDASWEDFSNEKIITY